MNLRNMREALEQKENAMKRAARTLSFFKKAKVKDADAIAEVSAIVNDLKRQIKELESNIKRAEKKK